MGVRKKKDILIVVMVFALCTMAVAYASLSQKLEIGGSVSTKSQWLVEITGVEAIRTQGTGTSETANQNITTASFAATLRQPGDSVTYTVTVENKGALDARLDSIVQKITPEVGTIENPYITAVTEGIMANSILPAGESIRFDVTIQCNPEATSIVETDATLTLSLNYVQNI